jgi:hypothetical protein
VFARLRRIAASRETKVATAEYVTRAEFDALVRVFGMALARVELAHQRPGHADGNVATQLELAAQAELPAVERAALTSIITAFDRTMGQHHAAGLRRDRERDGAYQRINP